VQGTPNVPESDANRQREIVAAFLDASRSGNFDALLELLDPDVVLRADDGAAALGAVGLRRGADEVAGTFSGRAQAARLALIDGLAGAVLARDGYPHVVFAFTVIDGRITEIELLGDDDYLAQVELTMLEN
jgi:RNA polymerase sigma-70 factor (ECF subfamily)